jgi:hypothetical protein
VKWEDTLVYIMYTPTSLFPVGVIAMTVRGGDARRRDLSCTREEEQIERGAGVEDRDRDNVSMEC